MYLGPFMGEARKWSFRSALKKHAPNFASKIVLFIMIFVSRREAEGDAGSSLYGIFFPPTTHQILHCSSFRGRWSHTNDAYVTFLLRGTALFRMNSTISVPTMPWSLP